MELENPLSSLRSAADTLLNAEGIFPILDYGWVDQDTPSNEYTGLAMWLTDAPFELEVNLWDRTSPPPEPTTRDEIFLKAGEDFIGTMELARNSIGLTLHSWQYRKSDDVLDDEEEFWEHRAVAAVWLNVASDRIRDYFIMARFDMSADEYKEMHKKKRTYARPFQMRQSAEGKLASKVGLNLIPLAEQIKTFRLLRDEIVHGVASRKGRNAMISLSMQRERATRTPFVPNSPQAMQDSMQRKEIIESIIEEKRAELRDAIQKLREWYLLLVRIASLVFEYEYWIRIKR